MKSSLFIPLICKVSFSRKLFLNELIVFSLIVSIWYLVFGKFALVILLVVVHLEKLKLPSVYHKTWRCSNLWDAPCTPLKISHMTKELVDGKDVNRSQTDFNNVHFIRLLSIQVFSQGFSYISIDTFTSLIFTSDGSLIHSNAFTVKWV